MRRLSAIAQRNRSLTALLLVVAGISLTACKGKAKDARQRADLLLKTSFGETTNDRDRGAKALLAGSLALATAGEVGAEDEGPCRALAESVEPLETMSGVKRNTDPKQLRVAFEQSASFGADGSIRGEAGTDLKYAGLSQGVELKADNCWVKMTE